MINRLTPEQLCHRCRRDELSFESTNSLTALAETIGQDRLLESLQFGVGIQHEGYNLYVMGSSGLGRHTVVRAELIARAALATNPADWCYVADFDHPQNARALQLPPGQGQALHQDMERLVDDLLSAIPAAFQSDEYRLRAQEISEAFKKQEESAATGLGSRAHDKGIALLHTPTGYTLAAELNGKILSNEEFENLPPEQQQEIESHIDEIKQELKSALSELPLWQREMQKQFKALERETSARVVNQLIKELQQKYAAIPAVVRFLSAAEQNILENVDQFRQSEGAEGKKQHAHDPEFNRYRINVLVDNAQTQGAPVIYEDNPTYQNLIGRIEHLARLGTLLTDFTLIKAGALHRANGGYLILDIERLLTMPFAWEGLKRSLKSREIHIESLERQLSLISTISLEPEPIPIHVKVVLVGSRLLYYLLKEYDPEFTLLFKVAADFSEDMQREQGNDLLYARLIATLQKRDKLRPIEREGVACIIEESARRAGDGERLSLHMDSLIDLLKEADYWAAQAHSNSIREQDVQSAIDAQLRRVDQVRERLYAQILQGTLLISTKGSQLAQINALTVIQMGDYSFGSPTRISATARMGTGELIDIEREVEQAGQIHSKGVMILAAYLANRYAKHQPLSLTASLVFEQTYGGVDGDSASAAELCALLSALSDIPLKQCLAITGSINQHGEMQAIGGINEKIEGFFDICQARGLSGKEGVIMPSANIRHLMLRRRVIEAVEQNKFHIYAIDHVEQAMELLTGLTAGVPNAEGIYAEETINGGIQMRLAEWTLLRQQFGGQPPPNEPS